MHVTLSNEWLENFWRLKIREEKQHRRRKSQQLRRKKDRQNKRQYNLTKFQKFMKQGTRQTIQDCRQSQRRAILVTPQGLMSGVKLLPYTNHKFGVVGSLLNVRHPLPVAFKQGEKRSKILAMGANRDYDEPWDIKPYQILSEVLQMTPLTSVVKGTVLLLKMSLNKYNMAFIDDLPLIDGIEYVEQMHIMDEDDDEADS